ncbi:MAG: 4Fe-4S dicluster domain-containing protein [Desulfobulbaceae bacterium]|nr:4Fe-4S dicluster domain-containing protein [Desulfobulbaceae bacterium]
MKQYAMIIDLDRCVGCHTCAVSCRAEWDVPIEYARCRVERLGPHETPFGISHTFYPAHCMHCDRPACVDACPVDPEEVLLRDPISGQVKSITMSATWKDPFSGTVQIDSRRCIGCGTCVSACPYGARFLNTKLPEPKAQKCTFCIEKIVEGEEPACVQSCITGARIFGDLNDSASEAAQYVRKGVARLESAAVGIGPNLYFTGNKKDISLLQKVCTPDKMPIASSRRALLSTAARRTARKAREIGTFSFPEKPLHRTIIEEEDL